MSLPCPICDRPREKMAETETIITTKCEHCHGWFTESKVKIASTPKGQTRKWRKNAK